MAPRYFVAVPEMGDLVPAAGAQGLDEMAPPERCIEKKHVARRRLQNAFVDFAAGPMAKRARIWLSPSR